MDGTGHVGCRAHTLDLVPETGGIIIIASWVIMGNNRVLPRPVLEHSVDPRFGRQGQPLTDLLGQREQPITQCELFEFGAVVGDIEWDQKITSALWANQDRKLIL